MLFSDGTWDLDDFKCDAKGEMKRRCVTKCHSTDQCEVQAKVQLTFLLSPIDIFKHFRDSLSFCVQRFCLQTFCLQTFCVQTFKYRHFVYRHFVYRHFACRDFVYRHFVYRHFVYRHFAYRDFVYRQ